MQIIRRRTLTDKTLFDIYFQFILLFTNRLVCAFTFILILFGCTQVCIYQTYANKPYIHTYQTGVARVDMR